MSDLAVMALAFLGSLGIIFAVCLVVGGLFSLALRFGDRR